MPLSEQHRAKLDSLVQQMEAGGESEDDIRLVVEDYKQKYGAGPPSAPNPILAGAQGFLEHNQLTAPFAHPVELAKDAAALADPTALAEEVAQDPTALHPANLAARAGTELAKGAYNTASGETEKRLSTAIQDFNTPVNTLSEALTKPLKQQYELSMAGLAAFPLTTGISVAAGKLEDPATRAEGLGAALGEASNVLIPFAPKGARSLGNKVAPSIEARAIKDWAEAQRPMKSVEPLALDIAEESLKRHIWGTENKLRKLADTQEAQLGAKLEQIYKNSPATLDVGVGAAPLQNLQNKTVFGGQQYNPGIEKAAQELAIKLHASGELPVAEAWKLRQELENPAARRNAYMPGADPSLAPAVEAGQTAADALRPALGEAEPLSKPVNQEYSYFRRLQTVLDNAKKPRSLTTDLVRKAAIQGLGVGLGALAGGPAGAIAGGKLGAALALADAIKGTTFYKTGSANLRYRLAQALKTQDPPAMLQAYQGDPAELKLPEPSNPDLEAFAEPVLEPPTALETTELPRVWGGDSPDAFRPLDAKAADLAMLQAELQHLGWEPPPVNTAGLSAEQILALSEADQRATTAAIRTIKNPSYQRLPTQGQGRLKYQVLADIFNRHRKLADLGAFGGF